MTELYFEDFHIGRRFVTDAVTVSEAEIIEFGRRFAPLPYHTDPVAAQASAFGALVAPGHLTASIAFGLFVRTGALDSCGDGSPGIEGLRWHAPVRPGDTLHVEAEVIERSPARRPGGRDAVRMRYETINQHGEVVMTTTSLQFLKRRPPA